MVTVYTVKWTLEAKNDLRQIKEYITCASGKEQALYVVTGIREKAKDTSIFPTKHAKEPYLNNENIRYAIKWSYKIIFEIKDDIVCILSIFHAAQNPEKLTTVWHS